MEAAGDFFQPRRKIDSGTDAGEVEPVAAADIAVQNSPDMQRDPEAEALDSFSYGVIHRIDTGARLARGFQYARANLLNVAVLLRDRKDGEQPVAHEFQNFPAMRPDRRHLAVKIMIEDIHYGFRRQPVRKRGKAAQIRQPDRGIHRIGVAAPYLPAENPLAGAVADIGVEQERSGTAKADDFDDPRQRRNDFPQALDVVFRKPAHLFRGPARRMD